MGCVSELVFYCTIWRVEWASGCESDFSTLLLSNHLERVDAVSFINPFMPKYIDSKKN
jgi:hypothetical protein